MSEGTRMLQRLHKNGGGEMVLLLAHNLLTLTNNWRSVLSDSEIRARFCAAIATQDMGSNGGVRLLERRLDGRSGISSCRGHAGVMQGS